jgi:phosphate acyltransferase
LTAITIAIDAMGGDFGCPVTVPAALTVLEQNPEVNIILLGDNDTIQQQLKQSKSKNAVEPRLIIQHTSEVVAMDEPPGQALRFKKDSSMRVALNLLKDGQADACVSAGNTGALMATAKFVLKTLPGIDRPAISALCPSMNMDMTVRILDLGANVDSSPEQLFQFAVMGSVLVSALNGVEHPKVALLNIGSEEIKGNEQVKLAAKLLENQTGINYIGFVEGDDIYKGVAHVVVCDGFVGNVVLKASEGLAKLMAQSIKEAFNRNILTRVVGLSAKQVLRHLAKRFDPARYNGGSLVGLRRTVVKSHGSATILGFANAISQAIAEVRNKVPERIGSEVSRILQDRQQL